MSLTLYFFFGFVAILLLALGWALRPPRKRRKLEAEPRALEELGQRHVTYLPQIRQAFETTDYEFRAERASREVQLRVRRERRGVALAYLAALRRNFQSLLRMARVIAALSPEVVAVQEFERLRLTAMFAWRYQMIRWRLWTGMAPMTQLDGLSNLVSGLSVRLELAVHGLRAPRPAPPDLPLSINRPPLAS